METFSVQVLSSDEFNSPSRILLPGPILPHSVATINIQIQDGTSFNDIIAVLTDLVGNNDVVGAVHIPRLKTKAPAVWAIFHPRILNPTFRVETFYGLRVDADFTIAAVQRLYREQATARGHLRVNQCFLEKDKRIKATDFQL